MQKLLIISLLCVFGSLQSYEPKVPFAVQKGLYAAAAVGSVVSIRFWLPETLRAIQKWGVLGAIRTTHIPRIALDVAVVGLCVQGFRNASKLQELALKVKQSQEPKKFSANL